MNKSGLFIVFEGLDKTGKSTQCKKLQANLNNLNIINELITFPIRNSPTGKIIDDYLNSKVNLNDQTAHLLFSANRWDIFEEILTKLKSGITIITDRYAYSGVVYSLSKRNIDYNWLKSCDSGMLKPDIIIFLDSGENNIRLPDLDWERYETEEFQKLVHANYFKIFEPEFISGSAYRIDANKSEDNIAKMILNIVLEKNNLKKRTVDEGILLW